MPFKSKSQRRLCYAKSSQAKRAGRTPDWDCPAWDKETPNIEGLPERLSRGKRASPKPKRSPSPKPKKSSQKTYKGYKIYVGPKGGKYIKKNGNKIYV